MPAVANFLLSTLTRYRRSRGPAREAGRVVIGLLVGVGVLPLLIWAGGQFVLGAYIRDATTGATGGLGAFWWDYLAALGAGSPVHWLVVFGPYVIFALLRLGRGVLRV